MEFGGQIHTWADFSPERTANTHCCFKAWYILVLDLKHFKIKLKMMYFNTTAVGMYLVSADASFIINVLLK
jgi:hypothetical protein